MNRRILAVDYRPDRLSFLESQLGAEVDYASTIGTAVKRLSENRYSVLVVHVSTRLLPEERDSVPQQLADEIRTDYGGLGLVAAIRKGLLPHDADQHYRKDVPIVLFSGLGTHEIVRKARHDHRRRLDVAQDKVICCDNPEVIDAANVALKEADKIDFSRRGLL